MASLTATLKVRVSDDDREWVRARSERTERSESAILRAALRLYRERCDREDGQVRR